MKKIILSIAFSLVAVMATSQSFHAESKLQPVEKDGFYFINLGADLCAYSNPDLTDLRIYDSKNVEVPYLLEKAVPKAYTSQFREYQVLEKKQTKGVGTQLILSNPDRHPINNISLVIKNAEVTKEATLLGSDDRKSWFAVKQSFYLHSISNTNGVSTTKVVDFPLSNYLFYSLEINDSSTAPLNIMKAGYFEISMETGSYSEVPNMKVTVLDSVNQKMTFVRIQFDTIRLIDKMEFEMKGQPYFLREATLFEPRERILKKGKREKYYDPIQSFQVSSTHTSVLELPGMKAKELVIAINNNDNPKLDLTSAKTYQLNRYAVAWLRKGETYSVKTGNEKMQPPSYDIAYFKDSIPDNAPVLVVGEIVLQKISTNTTSKTFFTSKNFIWAAIVVVIVLLALMSFKLTREVGKK